MRTIKKILLSVALLAIFLSNQVHAEQSSIYESSNSFTVFAYCACVTCCGKEDKITKEGTVATEGRTIAVDPTVIPKGSTVLIYYENSLIGIYQAEDIGGAILENRIDLYFEDHQEAWDWGIKDCDVIVVDAKG